MKFLIEFSQSNLSKFRQFIKLCNKTFTKTGIIMTIEKDIKIRVAPDPYSISDHFSRSEFETKVMEIYKNFTFIEYPLISINNSKKSSTYNTMEIKTREKNNDNNNIQQGDNSSNKNILTFRISKEEFNELNNLLNNSFISSNELTIKAANKPDFLKKEESKNYSNAYLSIFDKSKNSIKSGILFKPLKDPVKIIDYEDDFLGYNYQDKDNYNINPNLGSYLYHSPMKSKFLKKFCSMASSNFNKNIIIYTFKERDPNEKFDKNNLIISYLNNSFFVGCFIFNNIYIPDPNISIYLDQLKKIYKITLNSEIIIKLLKNFVNDPKNPDYIAVWTKGLVMKTDYIIENDDENCVNINQNGEGNLFGQEQEEISENEINPVILLKSFIYYPNEIEVIEYDENEDKNHLSKKDYILNLIEDNIDDKHEELNKSFDCSLDDIGGKDISFDENNFFNEEDEDNKKENIMQENNNDISNDEEKSEENNIKKKKKNVQKIKKSKKVKKKNKNENKDD